MRLKDEEMDVIFGENGINAWYKSTFRQPDTARCTSKMFFVVRNGDADLGASRFVSGHEREEAVCGTACDDFEGTFILELFENRDDLTVPFFIEEALCFTELIRGASSGIVERRALFCDFLFLCEFFEFVEVSRVAFLKEWIGEHFAERWRHAHGKSPTDVVIREATHHSQERDISFCHGFKQPVFLEKIGIFRMSDKRQVGMQDNAEVSL